MPTNFNKGFTLIEIMVSISILSIALVLILQSFAHSLNILKSSQNYLAAALLLENKMAEIEISFKEGDVDLEGAEEIEEQGITFKLEKSAEQIECARELESGMIKECGDLYQAKAFLSWQEGKRRGGIPLEAYMISYEEGD